MKLTVSRDLFWNFGGGRASYYHTTCVDCAADWLIEKISHFYRFDTNPSGIVNLVVSFAIVGVQENNFELLPRGQSPLCC